MMMMMTDDDDDDNMDTVWPNSHFEIVDDRHPQHHDHVLVHQQQHHDGAIMMFLLPQSPSIMTHSLYLMLCMSK